MPRVFTDVTYGSGGLAWITNQPPSATPPSARATVDELVRLSTGPGSLHVGVIALTGAGEKAFCHRRYQKQRMRRRLRALRRAAVRGGLAARVIRDVPKPTIAASTGLPSAGGTFSPAGDLLSPPTQRRSFNDARWLVRLPVSATGLMPRARRREAGSLDLVPLSQVLSAQQAFEWAWSNRCCPADQLPQDVRAWGTIPEALPPRSRCSIVVQHRYRALFAGLARWAYSSPEDFSARPRGQGRDHPRSTRSAF